MISLALGDRDEGCKNLERALALNPNFDPKHAGLARAALAKTKSEESKEVTK